MKVEVSTDVNAPAERVWDVMRDVERWPEWTPSMTKVERLDGGEFAVGTTARVKQPRLPASTWRVTALDAGRGFVWETRTLGTHTIGGHRIEQRDSGSRVTLSIQMTGGLTPLLAPLTSRFVRRYMEMEASGLKKRCEDKSRDTVDHYGI